MKDMFKRILVTMLALMLAVSTISFDSNAASSSQKKKAIKGYYKILNKYYDAYNLIKAGKYGEVKTSKNLSGLWCSQLDVCVKSNSIKSVTPVYSIKDVNSDGIPELFVGLKSVNSVGRKTTCINAVYAYKKKAIMLAEGTGDRAGIELHKKGIIETWHYGGAGLYGHTYSKLPKKKTKLKDVINIEANWGKFSSKKNGGAAKSITQTEFENIEKKYDKTKVSVSWLTLNKNALTATKNGYASYKTYKKNKKK